MHRLPACFLLLISACRASDDPAEILARVRQVIAAQIKKSANYTCVQTVDRAYFAEAGPPLPRCSDGPKKTDRKPIMHDRLRLDVAVSEGNEIYSWHGENKFSSSMISDVVGNGPISSGNFIGFLHNIFLVGGIQFKYSGRFELDGATKFRFDYVVPLAISGYHVQAKHGSSIVPFHGSFIINAADYQLSRLQVIADSIPPDTRICSAETDVSYQMVNISGSPSLVPAVFVLRMNDDTRLYTVNRNEYSQCREFRGESTLRFDLSNEPVESATASERNLDEWLPAGLTLRVGLRTPIDDRTSYTGDAVEGILLGPLQEPDTQRIIPKGAVLHGVITLLEHRQEPWKHHLLSVRFDRLTYGKNSFLLSAVPKTPEKTLQQLGDLYGSPLPSTIAADCHNGVFAVGSSHLRFDSHFSGEWITMKPPDEALRAKAP